MSDLVMVVPYVVVAAAVLTMPLGGPVWMAVTLGALVLVTFVVTLFLNLFVL